MRAHAVSRRGARRAGTSRSGTVRRTATALLGAGLLLSAGAMTAAAAPGGYGPVAPAAEREVGWAKSVLVTRTVADGGDSLAATQDGFDVVLDVSSGAFASPAQVTLYRLAATDLAGSLRPGENLVAGWSVTATSPDGGTLGAPEAGWQGLRLHVRGQGLGLPGQVVRYMGPAEQEAAADALQPGVLDLELSASTPGALVVSSGAEASGMSGSEPSPTGTPLAPLESVSDVADPSSPRLLSTTAAVVVGGAVLATGGVLARRRWPRR
ncbi:MAG: hypothetical protein ACLGIA_04185 [Actinomycetes bacterium]